MPAALERLLAREVEGCHSGVSHSHRPLAWGKPAVVALESREAPQWMWPAWGLVGASFAAAAAHALVSTPPAPATEYVDLRVADRVEPAAASAGSGSAAARGDSSFVLSPETAGIEPWNDGFTTSLASLSSLEGDHQGRSLSREGPGNLLAAASFAGEQMSGGAMPSLEQAPSEASLATLPGEPESGGGGDSPNLAGKSPPAAGSAPTQPPHSQSQPAAATPPPSSTASPPSGTLSSSDLNSIAHSLTNPPRIQAPGTPRPLSSPLASDPGILAVGPDAGNAPVVSVYDATTLTLKFTINAYPTSMTGGVRVAVGDVNGDGTPDIISGPGKGGGSLVKVFSGVNGRLLQSFNAYAPGQTDGVFVAAGDVNGDGRADIITGTDVGAKPLVKVFSGVDDSLLSSFISDPLAGANGVRVAAGDVNGDGKADIITGAGPGGPPRVTVVDGVTHKELDNFYAADWSFRGGVYVAAADLDSDGKADVITGAGSAGVGEIHTWSGPDLHPLGNVVTGFGSAGARVGAAVIGSPGQVDILAASGPGAPNTLNTYDGRLFTSVPTLQAPAGLLSSSGLFVAGDPPSAAPTAGRGSPDPTLPGDPPHDHHHHIDPVTVTVDIPVTQDINGKIITFTASRTDTTTAIQVPFGLGGTAIAGTDYYMGFNQFNFGIGQATATAQMQIIDDGGFDTDETVVLTLSSGQGYTLGSPSSAQVTILELPIPIPSCNCGSAPDTLSRAPGLNGNPISPFSAGTVEYGDGVVKAGAAELSSAGFGVSWGLDRDWTNAVKFDTSMFAGPGSAIAELPYLLQDGYMHTALISNGTTLRVFDAAGSGVNYPDRYGVGDTWLESGNPSVITITDTLGDVLTFTDNGASVQFGVRGVFKSFADPYGNVTSVTSWYDGNHPAEIQRSNTTNGVTVVESYLFTWANVSGNVLLTNVTLRRGPSTTGPWTTVRQVAYTYDANNNLKFSKVEDAAGNVLDTRYDRYFATGDPNGYTGGLKYTFGPESYARLVAALGTNVDSLTDAQVAPYADQAYQFDATQRATQAVIQGAGCSGCGSGLGTYGYSYNNGSFPNGNNNWSVASTETLPDGNTNTVYTNFVGQVLLTDYKDVASGNHWVAYYQYNGNFQLIEQASPSAVVSYDPSQANLGVVLNSSSGLITITDYGASTTATSSMAGDVSNYYKDTKVQQGSGGTPILQSQTQYFSQTANGITIYPTATQTVYRNTGGTGAETTSYAYTFFTNTNQVQSMTVTKPVISSSQNGPGVADTEVTFYDQYDRPIWTKDDDGFINYTEYDQATGAVDKTITDVNTSLTSDFMNLPSGWMTPTGGGLHLKTLMTVDGLGRTTKVTDPVGDVAYTVYNDTNYEVRTYAGWNSTTNLPTGPIQDSREDRPGSYMESLTFNATPHLTNMVPDGTESIANIQSLSRSYSNSAGQTVRSDAYFSLSGVTYGTAKYIGTQNTNYYTTLYDYDNRGRQNRVQLPTGTINRTVYDGLGRVISTWVGTNDTPAMGMWSPTNNTSPSNMTQITANVYDGTQGAVSQTTGVGDGNLTQTIQYPGGSAANRVTNNYFDWRDRLVATKSGVQSTEDTTTHRPLLYYTLDNLSEPTQVQSYDGDTVTLSFSGGVPQAPSSSLLRAQTNTSYDDEGRVYLSQTYSVNPSTGAVSSTALSTNTWYNHRGLVIETSQPGGLKTKNAYDGAARTTAIYMTDGNGDAAPGTTNSWANAGTVSSTNNVLEQDETTYDADGNVILTTTRQRNHDETTGGPLGNETTTPKARVSFMAYYYDLANRITNSVDVGTNGTGTYTRPSSPPAASDTVLRTDTSYAGDNVQQVTLTGNPTGGTFTLTFGGQTTSAIAYNASAATVQSALQALSSIGSGNALVGNPTGSAWIVRFAGTKAGAPQAAITGNGSGLTGGTSPSVSITATSLGGDAGRVQQTTDPRGIITKTDTDWLGRTLRTVEAFSTFNPSGSSDKTTEYSYDGDSNMLTLQADLAGGAYEQTKWIYGVTTSGGSNVNSNDILASMQYPNKTTGNPSSSEQETYQVNALGQRTSFTDRNGNVHSYSFDVLGRPTSDSVTTLGSGVDGAVRRIDTAYDTQGNAYLLTSYSDTGGATIVNQVQRAFNGLAQMTQEWQSHSGAANTSTTPSVQYAYSLMAGGANHSRLTSITYPNGKILNYNYNSGVDDSISRLSYLSDTSGTLESYSYLGLDTVVKRAHPQPNVDLTYITPGGSGDAGDQYTGLDRFGRIVDQKWQQNTTPNPTITDEFKYGYDRDSNRLYRTNEVNHSFDELYHANGSSNGYDNLNQLVAFARGTLNANHDTISSPSHSITWSLDALGNFSSTTTDGGSPVSNTFNKQNEETAAGAANLTFDNNGNTTTDDQGKTLVYDAWNRLVAYKNGSTTLESYKYDALNHRIVYNPGTVDDLYYSKDWQVLEQRSGGVSTATNQNVWSPLYVDALVLRDRSTQNNGTLDERLWVQQDANHNLTVLVNVSGSVVERYVYDPYGKVTFLTGSWVTLGTSNYAFIYLFQGGRFDTISALNNFERRDESPSLGRWFTIDPTLFAAGDTNLYSYVHDHPTDSVDPTGLAELSYEVAEKLTPGKDGDFSIRIKWKIKGNAKGGVIIQLVDYRWAVINKNQKIIEPNIYHIRLVEKGDFNTNNYPYMEAWTVSPCKDRTDILLKQLDQPGYPYGGVGPLPPGVKPAYDDLLSGIFFSDQTQPATQGNLTVTAEARFYEGMEIPKDFKVYNKPPTAEMPAKLGLKGKDAALPAGGSNTVKRKYFISWNSIKNGFDSDSEVEDQSSK
jgi:RHS repeat-associated protein